MRHCLALLMIAFAALSSTPADAEIFPDRPIHIVVPFPAGGSNDVVAREVAFLLDKVRRTEFQMRFDALSAFVQRCLSPAPVLQ